MKKVAFIVLAVVGTFGALLSISQFVMACLFAELGRVVVYFIFAILCVELTAFSVVKLIKDHKANRT